MDEAPVTPAYKSALPPKDEVAKGEPYSLGVRTKPKTYVPYVDTVHEKMLASGYRNKIVPAKPNGVPEIRVSPVWSSASGKLLGYTVNVFVGGVVFCSAWHNQYNVPYFDTVKAAQAAYDHATPSNPSAKRGSAEALIRVYVNGGKV